MAVPNQTSLLRGLLRILTPEEIDDLSRIYLSFFRKSLTGIIEEKMELEKKESGFKKTPPSPPPSTIKRATKKVRTLPSSSEDMVTGGVIFYLDEKKKFRELFKKQKKLGSTYEKNSELTRRSSKGILINKKCA